MTLPVRLASLLYALQSVDWRDVGGLSEDEAGHWRAGLRGLERAGQAFDEARPGDAYALLDEALLDLGRLLELGEYERLEALCEDVAHEAGAVEEGLAFQAPAAKAS